MPYPGETFITQFADGASAVASELRQFYALLLGYLSGQHKEDGSHAAVTADSVTLNKSGKAGALGDAVLDAGGIVVTPNLSATSSPATAYRFVASDARDFGVYGYDNGSTLREIVIAADANTTPVGIYIQSTKGTPATGTQSQIQVDPTGQQIVLSLTIAAVQHYMQLVAGGAVFSDSIKERARSTAMGEWTTFTPTRTATSGTWTGGNTNCFYMLVGKTMFVNVNVDTSSNSLATAGIAMAIPGGFTAARGSFMNAFINEGGAVTPTQGLYSVGIGGTTIQITKFDGTNFAANTNTLYVRSMFFFEVQ